MKKLPAAEVYLQGVKAERERCAAIVWEELQRCCECNNKDIEYPDEDSEFQEVLGALWGQIARPRPKKEPK